MFSLLTRHSPTDEVARASDRSVAEVFPWFSPVASARLATHGYVAAAAIGLNTPDATNPLLNGDHPDVTAWRAAFTIDTVIDADDVLTQRPGFVPRGDRITF
ncbi:hypothetical protein [Pengzhenrongella sp.]|jgi:hypothetical protein|uniref:hypothetical protein n=1 Tax=Pengzhenrongella sp. TaxID=2888820 RepID=UPI002F9351A0